MVKVKGTWTFKDTLTPFPTGSTYFERVNFTSGTNNRQFLGIQYTNDTAQIPVIALCYVTGISEDDGYNYLNDVYYYEEDSSFGIEVGWDNETYKTIDFGETEQEVSDEFYAWLLENTVAYVTEINITENGTTTLATAGKYCDRNIAVNVNVEDRVTDIAQGTIEGDYTNDKVTSLREYAFAGCANLTSISLPNCTSVSNSAFRECSILENINLPSCTTIRKGSISNGYVFDLCEKLKSINLPNLTTIEFGTRVFGNCHELEEIVVPNLTSITTTTSMCSYCKKLARLYFPKLSGTTINAKTFEGCYNLKKLVFGGNELNQLDNVNAFTNTPIAKGTGYVYVPDTLVDTYKTATNWVTYADQIKPMSELEG